MQTRQLGITEITYIGQQVTSLMKMIQHLVTRHLGVWRRMIKKVLASEYFILLSVISGIWTKALRTKVSVKTKFKILYDFQSYLVFRTIFKKWRIITPSVRYRVSSGAWKLGKGSFAEIKLEKGVILGFSGLKKLELFFESTNLNILYLK